MSYILEALRRAETERTRKRGVPGLHTQPVPVVSPEDMGARRSKAWLWVVVGVSAGVLLPLLWQWWASDPSSEEAAARTAVVGSVTPPSGAPTADALAATAPAPEPPAANANAPATHAAPERPRAPPTVHTAPKAAKGSAGSKPEPMPRQSTPSNVATAAPTTMPAASAASPGAKNAPVPGPAPASAPEPRLRSLAELPEELRRGVPQLAFGGSVYSEIAAQRMVIFNGQVLREGDPITDDLQVEQIRPRSAVLRMRGQRFELAF